MKSTFNMKGLYSSLAPPDISRLADQPAIMFSAWVKRESQREGSTVHSLWYDISRRTQGYDQEEVMMTEKE